MTCENCSAEVDTLLERSELMVCAACVKLHDNPTLQGLVLEARNILRNVVYSDGSVKIHIESLGEVSFETYERRR